MSPALKTEESATRKLTSDYDGDRYGLKDLPGARGSTKPSSNACGNSGFTAFVRTSTGYPAEGQINVPEILFAKMKPRSLRDIIGARAYTALMMKFQIDGGLGHGLDELWRERPASPEGKEAADVSCEYYEYFRRPPNFHAREKLPRLYRLRQRHARYFKH